MTGSNRICKSAELRWLLLRRNLNHLLRMKKNGYFSQLLSVPPRAIIKNYSVLALPSSLIISTFRRRLNRQSVSFSVTASEHSIVGTIQKNFMSLVSNLLFYELYNTLTSASVLPSSVLVRVTQPSGLQWHMYGASKAYPNRSSSIYISGVKSWRMCISMSTPQHVH